MSTAGQRSLACFLQVHKWMLRHVYYPAMRVGVPKVLAGVLVFFVSAVFHELLVGLPLHMLKAWSFIGIMSQARLVHPRVSCSGYSALLHGHPAATLHWFRRILQSCCTLVHDLRKGTAAAWVPRHWLLHCFTIPEISA